MGVLFQECYGDVGTADWGNSLVRKYLAEHVFNYLPTPLITNIKPVTKYYKGLSAYQKNGSYVAPSIVEKNVFDKLWIPSAKELHTLIQNYNVVDYAGSLSNLTEFDGIDYSEIYMPSYSAAAGGSEDFLLRSVGFSANGTSSSLCYISFAQPNTVEQILIGKNTNSTSFRGTAINKFPIGFCL